MAEINIDALLGEFSTEIGRLTGELIKQRAILTAEIDTLKSELEKLKNDKELLTKSSSADSLDEKGLDISQ